MQASIKIVGTVAVRDGLAVVVHGQQVAYEGPIRGAIAKAAELAGAVVVTSNKTKLDVDAMIARQTKGKPFAQ